MSKPLVMVTAYDAPTASILDAARVDFILVGDSVGTVIQGKDSTHEVTMDQMLYHTECVMRGAGKAKVIVDLPLCVMQKTSQALRAAKKLQQAGAYAVKVEHGPLAQKITQLCRRANIRVMGHVGVTPQLTLRHAGAYKVRGNHPGCARAVLESAKAFELSGAFSVVIECVTEDLAGAITTLLSIPTIGIGAGAKCSGQVLVFHDLLGMNPKFKPKFLKTYAQSFDTQRAAVEQFAKDVRGAKFPDDAHSYSAKRKKIRIGTRGSQLALTQTGQVRDLLQELYPHLLFELVTIKSTGDRDITNHWRDQDIVGVFTRELESALIKKEIDLAIHSLKDLPTTLPKGLVLAAFPKRHDARDVLITKKGLTLKQLPQGAAIGTGSLRRERQVLIIRPDLKVMPIRGNVNTRIQKVMDGELHAIILAKAGVDRWGKNKAPAKIISLAQMLPTASQGILGLEIRSEDDFMLRLLSPLNHVASEFAALAERSCLKTMKGGCRVPIGIHAIVRGQKLRIHAKIYATQSNQCISQSIQGKPEHGIQLGRQLAQAMLKKGGRKLLNEVRSR